MNMPFLFGLAATLCAIVGLAHSVLGERYILMRLFRRSDGSDRKLVGPIENDARCNRRIEECKAVDRSRRRHGVSG